MRKFTRRMSVLGAGLVASAALFLLWERAPRAHPVVVYFGHPADLLAYLSGDWSSLLRSAAISLATSLLSLAFAAGLSLALLAVGLLSRHALRIIEHLVAFSQTVPLLIVVVLCLLLEMSIARAAGVRPGVIVSCLIPVTIGLLFPPLVNGIEAVVRMPIESKYLLRLWGVPVPSRVRHVYLPIALPHVLTGLRASATWAVGATLITEGLLSGIEGGNDTLGHRLVRPFSSGAPGKTPAVIVISIALGFFVYRLVVVLHRAIEGRLVGRSAMAEIDYPLDAS